MKKVSFLCVFVLVFVSLFGGMVPQAAGKTITLKIEGKKVSLSQKASKVSGGYIAYAKDLAKVFKANFSYAKKKKTVTIKKGKKKLVFKLKSKKITVNKKTKKSKVKAVLKSKKPYVDILFTAKEFGYLYSEYTKKDKVLDVFKTVPDSSDDPGDDPATTLSEQLPSETAFETPSATPDSQTPGETPFITPDSMTEPAATEAPVTSPPEETNAPSLTSADGIQVEIKDNTGEPIDLQVYNMVINQTNIKDPITKMIKPPCEMIISIKTAEGSTILSDTTGTIEGRGNSTWNSTLDNGNWTKSPIKKAPYKLVFESKVDMVGMGRAKKWVLLANRYDKALMRTAIAQGIGQQLFTEFSPRFRFVELTLNGDYKGLYMLTDQMEEDDIRVDIKSSTLLSDDNPAFMLEWDQKVHNDDWIYAYIDDEPPTEGPDYFQIPSLKSKDKYPMVYKYPKQKDSNDAVRNYITNYMGEASAAMLSSSDGKFEDYIDVKSFYDFYIVNQFMLNFDCSTHSSIYMYKRKDGKLHMGPIWDFDISAGAANGSINNQSGLMEGNPWYEGLLKNKRFKTGLKNYWNSIKDRVKSAGVDAVDVYKEAINAAALRNHNKWGELSQQVYDSANKVPMPGTFDGEVTRLKTWLQGRYTWMDERMNDL